MKQVRFARQGAYTRGVRDACGFGDTQTRPAQLVKGKQRQVILVLANLDAPQDGNRAANVDGVAASEAFAARDGRARVLVLRDAQLVWQP